MLIKSNFQTLHLQVLRMFHFNFLSLLEIFKQNILYRKVRFASVDLRVNLDGAEYKL